MNEIICPHCKKAFTIDEASYADILQQVRNHEFEEELNKREKQLKKEKEDAVMLTEERAKNAFKDQLSEKERQYFELKADKDNQLTELQGRLNAFETEKALAVTEALNQVEKERDRLANELATEKKLKESELQSLEAVYKEKLTEEIKLKDAQLKDKDELIERYKDMKAKLSTKMIGETLEQHCEMEFNKLRPTAFPQSYFEKDNDSSTGTKGDYIYREKDHEDNEIISIMFEMKNESDDATKKQKIESHFKKLDEDRNKKGCEYAVMVKTMNCTIQVLLMSPTVIQRCM